MAKTKNCVQCKYTLLIARAFMGALFFFSGIGKIMNFDATVQFVNGAGFPIATALVVIAIALEIIGATSIVIGYKTRWGAIMLAVFLVAATFMFHRNVGDQQQMMMFLENFAIIGGLLAFANYGPGKLSLDEE